MPTPRTRLGHRGEELARRFLQENGCQILETNYRCPWGEIDIVVQDRHELVFVEVRTRRSTDFGTPEESITATKVQHLVDAAQDYLERRGKADADWRIDLISIRLGPGYQLQRIDHLPHAVQL